MGRQTIGTRMVRNTYHRMYRMNAKQHSLGSEMPVWTVESVDDLKSLRSIRGIHGPDFELLDARIASALNKIIQNTRFKKNVSLEEMKADKADPFLS